ncbi:hypothetical protein KB553_15800 [Chryseobacterium rhizoplanae]|uniref:hypothetical protein n=1 Tax=Chryseobacterium rhizoplanae TaxID=1609531 RepID=UPI001CE338E3|nr:hypothetical protein [Chryseobacterium rhizoplanae]UCA58505.1 hypothetical protein KB553_15800 [Chryseobacterium rhizoplanae]
MKRMEKEVRIYIRIQKSRKEAWKKICSEKQISLTSLIIHSVENRILDDERRKVLNFIEEQDNIFVKIETNINQVARYVNTMKAITSSEVDYFNRQLNHIIELKKEQNGIFKKIYSMIGK